MGANFFFGLCNLFAAARELPATPIKKRDRAMNPIQLSVAGLAIVLAAPSYASQACEVKSGAATAALVELYTSEGCSSCPPADRKLNDLRAQAGADALVVPLALHVSYWDGLGWSDPFAQKAFDARQSQLVERQRRHVVYTPQFFVNGSELRGWDAQLPAAIRAVNAKPAPLSITLKAAPAANDAVLLEAAASASDPRTAGALYLAVSESGLVSHVRRGENSGATLRHDATARLWLGPVALEQGAARLRKELALPAGWRRENLQAVAFVQDAAGGVLQAVSTASCAAPRGL
jgi:hypothetical protein